MNGQEEGVHSDNHSPVAERREYVKAWQRPTRRGVGNDMISKEVAEIRPEPQRHRISKEKK